MSDLKPAELWDGNWDGDWDGDWPRPYVLYRILNIYLSLNISIGTFKLLQLSVTRCAIQQNWWH